MLQLLLLLLLLVGENIARFYCSHENNFTIIMKSSNEHKPSEKLSTFLLFSSKLSSNSIQKSTCLSSIKLSRFPIFLKVKFSPTTRKANRNIYKTTTTINKNNKQNEMWSSLNRQTPEDAARKEKKQDAEREQNWNSIQIKETT